MTPLRGGWRAVYFIQRLISWIAPPLHSLHWKIFTLLLDNACAFTPAGKTVSLETTGITATVRDEGCGIEPALQAKVFERFFTTTNPLTKHRGTGLGLAIVKSLVLRAHGKIELRSTPGQGTDVTVDFGSPPTDAV